MSAIWTKATKKAILEALIADGGLLDTAKMLLFSNNLTVTTETTYADLTAAAFSGYAASATLVWLNPYMDYDTDEWKITCEPVTFRSTTATPFVEGLVYGYAIYIPGTPNVLRIVEKLPEVMVFNSADRVLTIVPEIDGSLILSN